MDFYEQFRRIGSDAGLKRFLHTYGFHEVEPEKRWNLGQYELLWEGATFGIGYRWYDPSQAFSIQKDIHKAELWTIDPSGAKVTRAQTDFPEDA